MAASDVVNLDTVDSKRVGIIKTIGLEVEASESRIETRSPSP
jgi:hypothetical protein